MSLCIPANALGPTETNLTAADRNGATITTGVANTKGLYSAGQLIAATAEDAFGLTVIVSGIHVAAADTSYLLDIGIGPSGSEVDLIQNLDCQGAPTVAASVAGYKSWFFPVFIPKGTRVAARGQALAATDVANVSVYLHQACNGWGMEVPTMWESLGHDLAASQGTSVTPGSGAFGSWTTILDPITKNYRWFHVGFDNLNDVTIAVNTDVLVEVGIGDTSAAVTTIGSWLYSKCAAEFIVGPCPD